MLLFFRTPSRRIPSGRRLDGVATPSRRRLPQMRICQKSVLLPSPPPPYIFAFWDPSGKFLPYIRSVQNFSSLLHLEHAFLKHQKPRNLQSYIVALAGFYALVCRSVASALSFVF
eukprot:sb/3476689/